MEALTTITPKDRLSFALFLALSLHAALILGVGFDTLDTRESAPTIEVTLATHSDPNAPEDADFLAQANQIGSGTEADVLETTTNQTADIFDNQLNELVPEPLPPTPETSEARTTVVTTVADMDDAAFDESDPESVENLSLTNNDTQRFDDLAQEIASLEARIAQEAQANARRPRVKRLTSVSTKTAVEAGYLNSWRQRVERIGNANYPGGGVFGDLRMLVIVTYDGTLKQVEILKSSGHKRLDEAALRIVRLAAPFPDFPAEMRQQYDQLEIIRTWKFSRAGAQIGV